MKKLFSSSLKLPKRARPQVSLSRLYNRLRLISAGGRWSTRLSARVRHSLRWLIFDGILANTSDAIIMAYQSVYLLTLGASKSQIGTLDALSNLAMPIAMVPGGRMAARAAKYKWLVVVPALVSRLLLFGLAFLPFLGTTTSTLVYAGIAIVVLRAFLTNLLNPAWTAMLGTLVPIQWRGRYFSTRNILMGGAAFFALLGVGRLIDLTGSPLGYQLAFGIAALTGLGASYALSRVEETPRVVPKRARRDWTSLWTQARQHRRFVLLCVTAALWNFAQRIAGPFFNVFFADGLQASAALIGVASAAATLAALPGQRIFGLLNDRKGARWVQRLTGFVIPVVPFLWGVLTRPWQALPVEVLSGFVWAGYNLAAFNLLLEMTPDEDRPSFVAAYQAVVGLGMAGGALVGGWLAQAQGYRAVFFTSAAGRLLAATVFALVIGEERPAEPEEPAPAETVPTVVQPDESASVVEVGDAVLEEVSPDEEARPDEEAAMTPAAGPAEDTAGPGMAEAEEEDGD